MSWILKFILVFRHIKKVDINGVTVRRRFWQTEYTATCTTEEKKGCSTADFEAPSIPRQNIALTIAGRIKHFVVRMICLQKKPFQVFSWQLCRSWLLICRHILTSDVSFHYARRGGVVFKCSFLQLIYSTRMQHKEQKKYGCAKNNKMIMIKYDGKFNIFYKFLASVYCFLSRRMLVLASCLRVCCTLTSTLSMPSESSCKA